MTNMLLCGGAIALALLLPTPESDPMPYELDCRCAMHTWYLSSVPAANTPTITVQYRDGSFSGVCDGAAPICPVVNHCSGTVNFHVVPKAFTQFGFAPSVFGVNNFSTFDWTNSLNACGETKNALVDVYGSPAGNKLGQIDLFQFCTRCSGS